MWQVDTTNHYKIWFSKNSDVFLDAENQTRFIDARQQNPALHFSLIYSSTALSSNAQADLIAFCKEHRIVPIDFDKDVPQLLKSDKDKALYALAKKEIEYAKDKGGNMAAASDCTRAIVAIIEKYRIYSDFDVELRFANIEPILKTKAPVLLAVEFVREANITQPCLNNECLVVSFDKADPDHLSKEAIEKISAVQDSIIARYAKPFEALCSHPVKGLSVELGNGDEEIFIKHFFKESPISDIFAFRQYILGLNLEEYSRVKLNTLTTGVTFEGSMKSNYIAFLEKKKLEYLLWRLQGDPDLKFTTLQILEKKLELLKHNLYVFSVSLISGPINYYVLNPETVPKLGFSISGNNFVATVSPREHWNAYCESYRKADIAENGLGSAFKTKNTFKQQATEKKETSDPLALVCTQSDQSWTPLGELEKAKRMGERKGAQSVGEKENVVEKEKKVERTSSIGIS